MHLKYTIPFLNKLTDILKFIYFMNFWSTVLFISTISFFRVNIKIKFAKININMFAQKLSFLHHPSPLNTKKNFLIK